LVEKGVVLREADSVGVQQHVIDRGIPVAPREEFSELRVQGRFPTGELENFDSSLAINHSLDASLQFRQGHRVHAGIPRRIREAGGAREVAGIYDLDQGETGGKLFHFADGLRSSAFRPSVPRTAPSATEQALPPQQAIPRIALRQPVKSRVRGDAQLPPPRAPGKSAGGSRAASSNRRSSKPLRDTPPGNQDIAFSSA